MFLEEESMSRRAMKQIPLVIPHIAAMRQRMDVTRYRVDLLALAQSAGHRPQIIVRMAKI